MGLKPAFYRVDENSIPMLNQLRKTKTNDWAGSNTGIKSFQS
jgi:hypothetical protein